jgi:hypothetical protein
MVFVIISACSSNQSKIDNLREHLVSMERDSNNITADNMNQAEQEIALLDTEIVNNRSKFTQEQILEFGKLKGRYAALLVKKGLNDFKESVKDFGNQVEGFMEGITDSTDKNQ